MKFPIHKQSVKSLGVLLNEICYCLQLFGIQRIYLIFFSSCSHISDLEELENELFFHDLNYVNIRKRSTGCASTSHVGDQNVGKVGGQRINLGPNCFKKGSIIHEFIHAFGFYHEHVRADRDNYIELNMDKIEKMTKDWQYQYKLQKKSLNYGLPYDGGSIMHYPSSFGTTFKSRVKIVANN